MSFLGSAYGAPVIRDIRRRHVRDTVNLGVSVVTLPGQRWELEIPLRPDSRGKRNLAGLISAHRKRNGAGTSFTVPMPQLWGVSKGYGNSYTTSAKASTLANSVRTNYTANATAMDVGRYIKFATHTKVYQVTSFALAGSVATVGLYPALVEDVASGTAMLSESVNINVVHHEDSLEEMAFVRGGTIYRTTLHVIEVR